MYAYCKICDSVYMMLLYIRAYSTIWKMRDEFEDEERSMRVAGDGHLPLRLSRRTLLVFCWRRLRGRATYSDARESGSHRLNRRNRLHRLSASRVHRELPTSIKLPWSRIALQLQLFACWRIRIGASELRCHRDTYTILLLLFRLILRMCLLGFSRDFSERPKLAAWGWC